MLLLENARRSTQVYDAAGAIACGLNVEQTAWVLNCQAHDVPILVSSKLLKPLGNPQPNGTKYFATKEVLELIQDEKWLHRVTAAICQHWQKRNARKNEKFQPDGEVLRTLGNF